MLCVLCPVSDVNITSAVEAEPVSAGEAAPCRFTPLVDVEPGLRTAWVASNCAY